MESSYKYVDNETLEIIILEKESKDLSNTIFPIKHIRFLNCPNLRKINKFPANVKTLEIVCCPELKILDFDNLNINESIENLSIINTRITEFKITATMKYLNISDCVFLKTIQVGKVKHCTFSNNYYLRSFEINDTNRKIDINSLTFKHCPNLKTISNLFGYIDFFEIKKCENIEDFHNIRSLEISKLISSTQIYEKIKLKEKIIIETHFLVSN